VLRAPVPAPGARTPSVAPPRPAAERRLAVVPLRTAGATEDGWIAEGLADDLVDALSLVRGLRVRGRAPAPTRDEDLRLYGRRHDVEVLVDGSVRREGERVRTHLRLVSIADGFQIWARRFDSSIGELLRIGDEAADAIAGALAGTENATPVQATTDPEAVELYLRAKRATDITPGRRHELVMRALELAPDDPTMLAAYARWAADGAFEPGSDPGLAERAMDAARRALAMAPALPDAHLALARVHNARDDDEAAMRAVLEARRIGPGMADPDDLLGRFLAECDLVREARAHLERALWIDPTQHAAMVDLLRCFALERRWDDVTSRLETLRTAQPLYYALVASRMWLWGAPVAPESDVEHVHPVMRRFDVHMRHIVRTGSLAPAFGADVADMCAQVPPVSRPQRLFRQVEAECRAFVGDTRGALEAVERSVAAGLRDLAWMRRCPLLDAVRPEPEFPALLATVEARVAPRIALYRAAAVPITLPAA
jgi:serine/threonine-protein kinase